MMENILSISKLMQHIAKCIYLGEKLRITSKDPNYLLWAKENLPSEQIETMKMSDEVGLLVIKQMAKNVISRMKNFHN